MFKRGAFVVLALLAASLLIPLPTQAGGGGELQGFITAYSYESSDPRWGRVARWTGEIPTVGKHAACPEEWRLKTIWVEGVGRRLCVDTPAQGWIDGRPHIDIYMEHGAALAFGVQYLGVSVVYPLAEPQGAHDAALAPQEGHTKGPALKPNRRRLTRLRGRLVPPHRPYQKPRERAQ